MVRKKQAHCNPENPDDERKGDFWDHVAIDAIHRLIVFIVTGKRTEEKIFELVEEVHRRTGGRMLNLIMTDEYKVYETAILRSYGEVIIPSPRSWPGKQRQPYLVSPPGLKYALIHKIHGEDGHVTQIVPKVIFGTEAEIRQALKNSPVSKTINTSFIERNNGTDRNRNARKARKTYCFSKDWDVHDAVTYFTNYSYNFCWPVRTLRVRSESGRWMQRTPAMSAGLADHVWTMLEWATLPLCQ